MTETTPIDPAELTRVPVFPLPRLVLFPGTVLPLHLFEPRYRALIEDCLAHGPMRMVVAQLKPGWEPDYAGKPPWYDTAGLARISEHRRNADGTHDVLLQGEARVFIEHEHEPADLPYRLASVRVQPERRGRLDPSDLVSLMSLAREIGQLVNSVRSGFHLLASADDPPGLLVDRLADQLIADPAERQDLLETLDVAQRGQVLLRRLAALHAHLSQHAHNDGMLH